MLGPEVPHVRDVETGSLQDRSRVASHVTAAPQELSDRLVPSLTTEQLAFARHMLDEVQRPARPQYATYLREHLVWIRDTAQDERGHDMVDAVVGYGQGFGGSVNDT